MRTQINNIKIEQKFKNSPAGKIPVDWDCYSLGEIITDIGDGGTPDTKHKEYFNGTINWAIIDDVVPEITTTRQKITKLGLKKSSAKLWPPGSVILTTGATIGKVGITKIPLATKQGITGIVPQKEKILPEFLEIYLISKERYLNRIAQGSTIREVRSPILLKLNVPLPSLREQKTISEIILSVVKAANETENIIAQTQALKKGFMQEFFTRGLPGKHKKVPVRDLLLFCQYGLNKPLTGDSSGIAVLRMNNLVDGLLNTQSLKYTELTSAEEKEYLVKDGDILFNRTNSRALVGKVALFRGNAKIAFASYLLRLRVNTEKANSAWLNYYLNSPLIQATLRSMATPGVSQSNINAQAMQAIKLNVPDLKNQEKAAGLLRALDERIEAETKKLVMLAEIKLSLSQVLLAGKVRVVAGNS